MDRVEREDIGSVLSSPDRVGAAARSRFPMSTLVKAGLSRDEARAASDLRRTSLRLTAAAEQLGVRKGTLDRLCREGVVSASFTRRFPVTGAGTVEVRHFLPADLDALDLAVLEIRSKAVRGVAIRSVT